MTNTIEALNQDIAEAEARIAVDMRIIQTARAAIKQLTPSKPYTLATALEYSMFDPNERTESLQWLKSYFKNTWKQSGIHVPGSYNLYAQQWNITLNIDEHHHITTTYHAIITLLPHLRQYIPQKDLTPPPPIMWKIGNNIHTADITLRACAPSFYTTSTYWKLVYTRESNQWAFIPDTYDRVTPRTHTPYVYGDLMTCLQYLQQKCMECHASIESACD